MAKRSKSLGILAVLAVTSAAALAVTPQFWENFTQEELLKGTFSQVSLSWDGKLSLAPAYTLVYDTGQPYIFSMVRDKAGNLYVGTGHEGKVFKIDPQGKGSLYFQSKELDVFALALDSSDTLYAGTSPTGKVYKVTAANQSTEFCDPEDKYIWSMLFDDSGNLYIGTGARGIIYKVDRSGKKSTLYSSADSHIVSLARGSNGNLLAGTSPAGRVLEITPQGKAFTLLDTPMEEVHSLLVDRFGTIYAVASSPKRAVPDTGIKIEPVPAAGGVMPIATIQALSALADRSKDMRSSVSAPGGEKDTAGAKAAIFAISRDSGVETIFSSKEQLVFDALVRSDEAVLAAIGGKGRLLSIDTAKQVTVLTDSPEEQITRLVKGGDFVYAAGSNQGKVYRLAPQLAQTGTYESRVLDAKTIASWGRIAWRATGSSGGGLELSTRSGNTDKPDTSWSDWSPAYGTPGGEPITSPRARYLQWRATFKGLTGTTPRVLERLQIAYLQQNLRPQVVSITLLPYGVALQKMPSISAGTLNISATTSDGPALNSPRERGRDKQPIPPRQLLQPGAQSFTWKATDDNDDTLEYSLFFKGESETEWKRIEKSLSESFYTLDSNALPDGVYTLKVVASDQPSNPFGRFLVGELISRPFVISNSTPAVEISGQKVQGRRVDVQFRARVSTGRIASAEFSIDGGEWFLLFPKDGIADSEMEEYQLTTPEIPVGEHIIGLRASDGNGNTGTAKLVVKIP